MKLKKIASLALAGVMAVSMLAGCSNGSNGGNANNNNDDNNSTVVPATSAVVDAVNKGQSASNAVKVDFTVNSKLDSVLTKAVNVYGADAEENFWLFDTNGDGIGIWYLSAEVMPALERMTGLESVGADEGEKGFTSAGWVDDNGFLTDAVDRQQAVDNEKDAKDKVYTSFVLYQMSAVLNEDAALNSVAENMDDLIADLAAHSDVDGLKAGDKYYTYSYDGNISMVSVQNLDGTTDYYVAYVINQTVAEATLK